MYIMIIIVFLYFIITYIEKYAKMSPSATVINGNDDGDMTLGNS